MSKLIDDKVAELRVIIEQELSENVVMFKVEFTGTGTNTRTEYKHIEELKRDGISMRNVKGEFIR